LCREWVAAHDGWVKRGDFGPLFLCPELAGDAEVIGYYLATHPVLLDPVSLM